MNSVRKTFLIVALSIISVLSLVFSALFALRPQEKAFADNLFVDTPSVLVEYDQSVEGVDEGRKGIKVTSLVDGRAVAFKSELGGNFEIAFRPLSFTENGSDFNKITFTIRSNDSRYGLILSLYKDSANKIKYSVSINLPEVIYGRSTSKDSTSGFMNTGSIAVLGFDVQTMEAYAYNGVSRVLLADLDNQNTMAGMSTTALFSGFSTYSVEMALSGYTANSASVLLYELNGQSLAGQTLTNSAGAELCGTPVLCDGVKGVDYQIDKTEIKTYDVIDGITEVKGIIKSVDPDGIETTLVDGKFTPDKVGGYDLTFIPEDQNGITGLAKTVSIKVYNEEPSINIKTAFPIEDMRVGVGALVQFPWAVFESELDCGTKIPNVILSIEKDGQSVANYSADKISEYVFNNSGNYTVTLKTVSIYGTEKQLSSSVVVSEDIPVFEVESKYEDIYDIEKVLSLPRAVVVGKNAFATATVYYPNGRVVRADNVVLDERGTYKVKYEYTSGQETFEYLRYFNVDKESASLWDSVRGVTKGFEIAPSYCAELYEGVVLTATRSGAKSRYANLIDLSDNGSRDKLLEFIPVPRENSQMEFSTMYVTLVDAYDQNNKVTVKFNKDAYSDHYVIYVSVCANKEGTYTKSMSVRGSFYGAYNSRNFGLYPAIPTTLYFDYQTLTLHASIRNNSTDFYEVVASLTDETQVGKGNAFKGFTSSLIYLEISFENVVASGANLMILNVDGQSMGTKYVDDKNAPIIDVDYDGNAQDNLPLGIVGGKYPVFKTQALDMVDGVCDKPQVKIYYYTDSINRVRYPDVNGEYFIPDKTGLYCIEYTATDKHENVSKKTVVVEIVDTLPALGYDFGTFSNKAYTGDVISIPTGGEFGGSGTLKVSVKVVKDGQNVSLDNNIFTPKSTGKYSVEVTVKDYVGTEQTFIHEIDVSVVDRPLFERATVPEAVLLGRTVNIAKWKAFDYSSGAEQETAVTLSVDGNVLSDWTWTPNEAGVKTLVFSATNGNGTTQENVQVEVLDATSSGQNLYLAKYFRQENVEISGTSSFDVTATADGGKITFVNPVIVDGFRLRFSVPADKNAYQAIRVTLVDTQNAKQKLVFDVKKNDKNLTVDKSDFVMGADVKEIAGSFFGISTIPFEINYSVSENTISDYLGNVVYIVEKAYDGSAWTGFESGKVYVSMEIVGKEGDSAFNLLSISNQTFTGRTKKDLIIPQIFYNPIINVNFGDMMTIQPAVAYDILSEVVEFNVTVYTPSGVKLLTKADPTKSYEFKVEEYGAYKIEYFVKDSAGNDNKYMPDILIVNVYDKIQPEITLNSTVPSLVVVGKSFSIPKAVITDNANDSVTLKVWIIEPNGTMVEVGSSYTPTSVGKYQLVYFASDNSGCTTFLTFEIKVGR